MSSRSATVLVIFIVACIAFCMATVFASMTGPISILPNESSGGVLDNLSAITDSDNNYDSYGYDDSNNDYDSYSYDDSNDDSQVETTTETTQESTSSSSSSSVSNVETTVDDSSSSGKVNEEPNMETTVDK